MIVVIDYNMGNVRSVLNAVAHIGYESELSHDRNDILKADALILPGVGAFKTGMQNLEKLGLVRLLKQAVLTEQIPIIGLCLGMQLFAEFSTENGFQEGLGFVKGAVKLLHSDGDKLILPHMGWNDVRPQNDSQLFDSLGECPSFYFVHSYAIELKAPQETAGLTVYGNEFVSALSKSNIHGTQFHPEKSQKNGLKLLQNFFIHCCQTNR